MACAALQVIDPYGNSLAPGGSNTGKSTSLSGNSVAASGGAIYAIVAGGYSGKESTTDNTVVIRGKPSFGSNAAVRGGGNGHGGMGDVVSGNTLKLAGFVGKVKKTANFENYEFHIPGTVSKGGTILSVVETTGLNNTNIDITGIDSGSGMAPGDTVTLISPVLGKPGKINGELFVEDGEFETSDGGIWKFSAASGGLIATLVSRPSGGGGGGGGCNPGYGFFALVLVPILFKNKIS